MIVALAGGVGGAKLAQGLSLALPPDALTVIGNTADDFEHLGLRISPDLDAVLYTLAGMANPETGWGVAGRPARVHGLLRPPPPPGPGQRRPLRGNRARHPPRRRGGGVARGGGDRALPLQPDRQPRADPRRAGAARRLARRARGAGGHQ